MDNMASLSASGLLDYHKLEHLLDHLLRSSTEQQAKIATLELELANRPTKADLQAHQTAITQTVDTLTKRLTDMESRIARIEDLVPTIKQDAASVQTILAAVPALATNAGLQQIEQKVAEQLHNTIEGLMADHVSRDCFSQLETSQRRLFEELVALQNMVACKIDRVEVPLLQASADRIKELIQSREEHSKRLQEIDASLARVGVSLEQKEDKETTVLRMQKIYAMLQQKAGQELTEERIVSLQRGVEEVSKQIVALSSLAELPPQVATLAHDAASARERLLVVEKAVGNAQSGVDSLAKQLHSKADVWSLQKKADKAHCDTLMEEAEERAARSLQSVRDSVLSVSRDVCSLKESHNCMDRKLALALRFIEAVSSLQLEKSL